MKKLVLAFLSMFIISVAYADTCPNGQYWDTLGGECLNCNNLPASYAHYTGPGTTINNCPWSCDDGYGWNGSACTACLNGQYGPNLSNACNACDAGEYGSPAGLMCYSCGGTGSWPNTYCPLNGGNTATVSTACPTNSSGSDSGSATVTSCYISSCNSSITECNPSHGHLSGKCYYATGTSLNPSSGTCTLTCNTGYHVSGSSCVANTITANYAGNGSTGGTAPASQTFSYNDGTTASANTYSKTGYTFTGWLCSGGNTSCDGDIISAGTNISTFSDTNGGTITLTAQWVADTFTLHVNPNNGGSVTDVTCTVGSSCNFSPSTPSPAPSGYTFLDWNTENDGSGTVSYTSPHTFPDASVTTLYARWKKTIDFQDNHTPSTTYATQTCYHNGVLALPTFPSAESSGFSAGDTSWYQDNHGGTVAYSSLTSIECDDAIYSLVYPKWNYTVSYDVNGGTITSPNVFPVASTCTKNDTTSCSLSTVPAMTRAGYVLDTANWNTENDGSGDDYASGLTPFDNSLGVTSPPAPTAIPAGNITLYAKWTLCGAGYWVDSGSCEECDVGYYCPGDGTNPKCPAGHTSDALSTAKSNCYMSSGTKFCDTGGTRCFHLPISNIYWHGI